MTCYYRSFKGGSFLPEALDSLSKRGKSWIYFLALEVSLKGNTDGNKLSLKPPRGWFTSFEVFHIKPILCHILNTWGTE